MTSPPITPHNCASLNAMIAPSEAASSHSAGRRPSTQPQNSKMMGRPSWLWLRAPPVARAASTITPHRPQTST